MDLTHHSPLVDESTEDTAIVEDSSAADPSDTSNNPSAGPVADPSGITFGQLAVTNHAIAHYQNQLRLLEAQNQRRRAAAAASRLLAARGPFPFFQMPAEIRNMVYGVLLTSEDPIVPHNTLPIPFFHYEVQGARRAAGPLYDPLPTLLRVSREFAREAAMVLYTTNTFHLDLTHHRLWLVRITRPNSFVIRHLKIKCFQNFGGNEETETWIRKLVDMGNTITKRCRGLTTLNIQFRHRWIETEEGGEELPARQCLQLFVENEAIRTAWMTHKLKRLKRVTILIHEEWEHTDYLVGLLKQLTGNVKRGVVVEARYVATVNRYRLPGALPNESRLTHVDQERKFFEGRYNRETRTVVTQVFPWEMPVGWPTIYRRVHE